MNNNVISIYDSVDGVGAVQFSTFIVPANQRIDLQKELLSFLKDKKSKIEILGDSKLAFVDYFDAEGIYWKYWLFVKDRFLILATYNCLREHVGVEDEKVNAIITSTYLD